MLEEQVGPYHMTLTFYYILFWKLGCFEPFLIALTLCPKTQKQHGLTFFSSSTLYVSQIVFLAM